MTTSVGKCYDALQRKSPTLFPSQSAMSKGPFSDSMVSMDPYASGYAVLGRLIVPSKCASGVSEPNHELQYCSFEPRRARLIERPCGPM
jgi:hypothetical protein